MGHFLIISFPSTLYRSICDVKKLRLMAYHAAPVAALADMLKLALLLYVCPGKEKQG